MLSYDLATEWWADAPVAEVWERIYHSEDWPAWWPGALSVTELDEGYEDGIANRRRYVWRGALPYRLTFDVVVTRVQRYTLLEGEAEGDVSGFGRWLFYGEAEGGTRVRHEWRVAVEKAWMRRMHPLARSVFRWNHDMVMRRGAKGLARRLGRHVVWRRGTPG